MSLNNTGNNYNNNQYQVQREQENDLNNNEGDFQYYQVNENDFDQEQEQDQPPQTVEDQIQEQDLADLLSTIIFQEGTLEQLKNILAENNRFDVWDAFKLIDIHNHGFICVSDLQRFFSKHQIQAKDYFAEFFIYEKSNPKGQDRLSFLDFLEIILPKINLDLRTTCSQRKILKPQGVQKGLSSLLEQQVVKIIELEIEFLREIETKKIDYLNKHSYLFRQSFNLITLNEEYINQENIFSFMDKYCQNYRMENYEYLQARLDRDRNKKMSMDEFIEAIFPSNFVGKNNYIAPVSPSKQFDKFIKGNQLREYLGPNLERTQRILQQNQNEEQTKVSQFKFYNSPFKISQSKGQFVYVSKFASPSPQNERKYLQTHMNYDKPLENLVDKKVTQQINQQYQKKDSQQNQKQHFQYSTPNQQDKFQNNTQTIPKARLQQQPGFINQQEQQNFVDEELEIDEADLQKTNKINSLNRSAGGSIQNSNQNSEQNRNQNQDLNKFQSFGNPQSININNSSNQSQQQQNGNQKQISAQFPSYKNQVVQPNQERFSHNSNLNDASLSSSQIKKRESVFDQSSIHRVQDPRVK